MALDGSGATQWTAEPVGRFRLSVSSDDKWVFYDDTRGESRKVSIDGGPGEAAFSADQLSSLGEPLPRGFHEATPSPDGSMLAGHYVTAQGERIVVIPMAGGPLKRFETLPPTATWAPDGRSFVFTGNRGGVSNLLRMPLAGGPPQPITQFTSEQIFTYALSPDQQRLAVVRGRVSSDVVLVSSTEK
jgi:hypothetical protein